MLKYKNDKELFKMMKDYLYSSVIGDILDSMGYLHQFLPQKLTPLKLDMVMAGRAMTVLEADAFEKLSNAHNPIMGKDFGLMLEALDDIQEDEIYICAGSSPSYALVGELMCTRMKIRGAAGAIAHGFHRDTKGILDLDMPCFSYGRYAQDQGPRGKVIDWRVPIEVEGVRVNPGDLIFGDLDGVVVIPQEIEREVVQKAYDKATGEKIVFEKIKNGMSCVDSWNKYHIM
jgi:regulator of RNase E activity RraA